MKSEQPIRKGKKSVGKEEMQQIRSKTSFWLTGYSTQKKKAQELVNYILIQWQNQKENLVYGHGHCHQGWLGELGTSKSANYSLQCPQVSYHLTSALWCQPPQTLPCFPHMPDFPPSSPHTNFLWRHPHEGNRNCANKSKSMFEKRTKRKAAEGTSTCMTVRVRSYTLKNRSWFTSGKP